MALSQERFLTRQTVSNIVILASEDLKVDVNLPFQRVSGGEALGDGIISMSKQKCYSSHLM